MLTSLRVPVNHVLLSLNLNLFNCFLMIRFVLNFV